MTDLIARLESAPEGSRGLDAEIALHLYPRISTYESDEVRGSGHWVSPDYGAIYAENYTTSLDAALTLVPEGQEIWWEVRQMCSLSSPMKGGEGIFSARVGLNYGADGYLGRSDNPALALCIAALKAREAAG